MDWSLTLLHCSYVVMPTLSLLVGGVIIILLTYECTQFSSDQMVSRDCYTLWLGANLLMTTVHSAISDGLSGLDTGIGSRQIDRLILLHCFYVMMPTLSLRLLGHVVIILIMMTSSNGNIFRVTGHLCGEFTGPRWIPHTKTSDANFDVYFDLHPKKTIE